MIVNLRGTSGSGKTTVIKQLRAQAAGCDAVAESGRIVAYALSLEGVPDTVYLMGRYETPCGGCDTIKTQDETMARIRQYASVGHVLAEGLLLSAETSRSIQLAKDWPTVFAFLDTPIHVCLQRIQGRRSARGVDEPFNEQNTISRHKWLPRVAAKLLAAGCDVRKLPWQDPTPVLLQWLREAKQVAA